MSFVLCFTTITTICTHIRVTSLIHFVVFFQTSDELKNTLNGLRVTNKTSGSTFLAPENIDIPKTVDWRPKGYVTPVKNQVLETYYLTDVYNTISL